MDAPEETGKPARYWTRLDAEGREQTRRMRDWERWNQHGGSGRLPTYSGNAECFLLHYALTGTVRMLLMAALAVDGTATIPQLTARWGWPRTRCRRKLESLERAGLVERVLVRRTGVTRQWHHLPAWQVTDYGRRCLWRFAWVSRRILYSDLDDVVVETRGLPGPVGSLEQRLQPELLRPSALAITKPLVEAGSLLTTEAMRFSGLTDSMCLHHLGRLARRGWVERLIVAGYEGTGRRPSDTWVLTEGGLDVIRDHVHALLWVMLECGHVPDEADMVFPAMIG